MSQRQANIKIYKSVSISNVFKQRKIVFIAIWLYKFKTRNHRGTDVACRT